MDKIQAIKATKNGAVAALISAGITAAVTLFAITTAAEGAGFLAVFNDPFNFVDVVLVLICAFGMYKQSRIASVAIFIYFIFAKIFIAIQSGETTGITTGLLWLYFYGKAIQGSFAYHKFEKAENPDYKGITKWTYIIGIPTTLIVLLLATLAITSSVGIIPSIEVLSAKEIKNDDLILLQNEGIISEEDEVEFFYSQGVLSILESGNILTQDRVIYYLTNENDEIELYEIFIEEITDIVLETEGGVIDDSVYKITTDEPERWMRLFLSTENGGDKKFIDALWNKII